MWNGSISLFTGMRTPGWYSIWLTWSLVTSWVSLDRASTAASSTASTFPKALSSVIGPTISCGTQSFNQQLAIQSLGTSGRELLWKVFGKFILSPAEFTESTSCGVITENEMNGLPVALHFWNLHRRWCNTGWPIQRLNLQTILDQVDFGWIFKIFILNWELTDVSLTTQDDLLVCQREYPAKTRVVLPLPHGL